MDTTVIMAEPADYGVGPHDRVTFRDTKYSVEENGDLHVHSGEGRVGSFPNGRWRAVVRGGSVDWNGPEKGTEVES